MIDSKGAAFGFDCCLASPKFRVFQQPARPAARLHINFFSRCRKRPDPADNVSNCPVFAPEPHVKSFAAPPRKISRPKIFWKAKGFVGCLSDTFSERHLRVRVLSPQPASPVSLGHVPLAKFAERIAVLSMLLEDDAEWQACIASLL